MIDFSHHRTLTESLQEYGRGVVGGIIFSLPLLYTMEVWQAGLLLHPLRVLACIAVTFLLLLAYNRHAGLRKDASFAEVAIDSVEEMGIGLVLSAAILWLMGRLHTGVALPEALAMVAVEAMTVAIGVSVGTAQLGASDQGDSGIDGENDDFGFTGQCAVSLCGAVLFAANIAPTDEVAVLAIDASPQRLILVALASIGLAAWVLHYADFRGADTRAAAGSRSRKLLGSLVAYAIALLASAGSLFFFGRLDDQPPGQWLARTVILGLPAALGASAGRLLLRSSSGKSSRHP